MGTIGFGLSAMLRPRRSRRHMRAWQLCRLRRLVRHAVENVPLYSEFYGHAGIDPVIRSLDDLQRLPVMDKERLIAAGDGAFARGTDREALIAHETSGSTGVPIRICRSPAEERRLNLLRWRMMLGFGLRPFMRTAQVKTTWVSLPRKFNRPQDLVRKTRLLDKRLFDCFEAPAETLRRLEDFKPHFLGGYPGALARVALEVDDASPPWGELQRVFCGGETVTPQQRRLLEERFGRPLTDTYGTTECNLAAWQCPETGLYHVCDDGIVLEICKNGRPVAPGETGEVLITSLHSYAMPLLRFRLGDLAVAGPEACPCGKPFSTIRELRGREVDNLPLPDGRTIHPFQLLNEVLLSNDEWIAQYQVVQREPGRFDMRVVPRRPPREREIERLHAGMIGELGAGVRLNIDLVDSIPADASGKLKFCRALKTEE